MMLVRDPLFVNYEFNQIFSTDSSFKLFSKLFLRMKDLSNDFMRRDFVTRVKVSK